jgi:hypothetical protein
MPDCIYLAENRADNKEMQLRFEQHATSTKMSSTQAKLIRYVIVNEFNQIEVAQVGLTPDLG